MVHVCPVRSRHEYTRSRTPWILSDYREAYGKLVHYLSGGGMRTFGRTVRQEEARLRQRRFMRVVAAIAALWLLFYFS